MLKFWKRNKDGDKNGKLVATHAVLTGATSRPLTEYETMQQLGINIHTIEDVTVLDTINQLIAICTEAGYVDFDLYALRNLASKLIRCSRLEKIDVFILLKKTKRILRRIQMNVPDELIDAGILNFLESIEILLWTAFTDSLGGWKGKLLKVSPRVFEISMPEPGKKKSGMTP